MGTADEIIGSIFDMLDPDGAGEIEEAEGKLLLSAIGCVAEHQDYYWKDLLRTSASSGAISKAAMTSYVLCDEKLTPDRHFADRAREQSIVSHVARIAKMDIGAALKLRKSLRPRAAVKSVKQTNGGGAAVAAARRGSGEAGRTFDACDAGIVMTAWCMMQLSARCGCGEAGAVVRGVAVGIAAEGALGRFPGAHTAAPPSGCRLDCSR